MTEHLKNVCAANRVTLTRPMPYRQMVRHGILVPVLWVRVPVGLSRLTQMLCVGLYFLSEKFSKIKKGTLGVAGIGFIKHGNHQQNIGT